MTTILINLIEFYCLHKLLYPNSGSEETLYFNYTETTSSYILLTTNHMTSSVTRILNLASVRTKHEVYWMPGG